MLLLTFCLLKGLGFPLLEDLTELKTKSEGRNLLLMEFMSKL